MSARDISENFWGSSGVPAVAPSAYFIVPHLAAPLARWACTRSGG